VYSTYNKAELCITPYPSTILNIIEPERSKCKY